MTSEERLQSRFRGRSPLPLLCGIVALLLTLAGSCAEASDGSKLLFLGNRNIAPVVYLDNSAPAGVAVDIVLELAKHIPQPLEIRAMDWKEAQALVAQGEADALIQINQTEERKKIYDFSDTLLESQFSIFTSTDRVGISDIPSLHGLQIGVEAAGLPRQLLEKEPGISLTIIPNFLEGFKKLNEGAIDAVVVDYRVGSYIIAQNKLRNIKVSGKPIASSYSSIAVKKGNTELLNAINNGLRIIKTDGTYRRILDKWHPKEVVFHTREQITQKIYFVTAIIFLIALLIAVIWTVTLTNQLTKRKAAEETLNRERSLLRCIIDSASDLIFIKNRDSVYLACNKASEEFVGLPEYEQIGKTDVDFFGQEIGRSIREFDLRVIEGGTSFRTEEWVTYPDGRRVLLDTLKVPFYGADGEISGLVGICRDITERKQAEEELIRLNDELEQRVKQRTAELETKNAELQKMNKVFVGRELRMIELKERIRELEGN